MANKIIQLKDGNDNLYPSSFTGIWSPQIYDYNTHLLTLTNNGTYTRVGDLIVYAFNARIDQSLTFNTMLQIRGFPFQCYIYGGNIYSAGATNSLGDRTIQYADNAVFVRPNYTGTVAASVWWSGMFIGRVV